MICLNAAPAGQYALERVARNTYHVSFVMDRDADDADIEEFTLPGRSYKDIVPGRTYVLYIDTMEPRRLVTYKML